MPINIDCQKVPRYLKSHYFSGGGGGGQGGDNLPLPVPRSPASRAFLFLCLSTPAISADLHGLRAPAESLD